MENLEKDEDVAEEKPLVHDFNNNKMSKSTPKIMLLLVIIVAVGVLSGYFVASLTSKTSGSLVNNGNNSNLSNLSKGTVVGSSDTTTFKDTAEGVLRVGGIKGEGAFHLERSGGESQNVYLTSSSVDLAKFVGKKIKVWGQTQKAQHAGWLMDTGRVEVL